MYGPLVTLGDNIAVDLSLKKYSNQTYPTPYIGSLDRADRCKQLFPKYNNTGTAKLSFVGQNTYTNPCKVECALCRDEEPDTRDNTIRSYPAHATLINEIIQCHDSVQVFEQYMEDGIKCGPYHVCEFCPGILSELYRALTI
ncbi:unnamed protein product [Medioppia subpectinata]|uniref:Uncharacterized protein n=1 Tax=Medioppia subpectinata TaxID=1979941 RepID=A0A7R9Q5T8_9ACAR|nr:unnamed protein product [Medioppia subpectinata]CAG2113185.1 unnamed protein product [Medioppia subpectinata]